jgi:hypothetical protein
MLVGMKSLRDSTVTEFADLGQALSNLNQTYSLPASLPSGAPSEFLDAPDFCDDPDDPTDIGTPGSKCVNVCVIATATDNGQP